MSYYEQDMGDVDESFVHVRLKFKAIIPVEFTCAAEIPERWMDDDMIDPEMALQYVRNDDMMNSLAAACREIANDGGPDDCTPKEVEVDICPL